MANTITLQFLTLPDIKAQARIESSFTDDDDYLMMLGAAAEEKLLSDIQRTYDEVVELNGGTWPYKLALAALLLTSQWYKHREPTTNQSISVVPYAYESLYMSWRKGTYSSVEEDE